MVDIKKKRDFLRDFVARFGTQTREERWLLEYLINSEYKLNNIIFVQELNRELNGFKIHAEASKNGKFEYLFEGKKSTDVSILFDAIHKSPDKVIYVEFEFEGKYNYQLYLDVVEAPKGYMRLDTSNLTEEELAQVDVIADTFIIHSQVGIMRNEIDAALDSKDEKLFMKLTNELNHYMSIHNLK